MNRDGKSPLVVQLLDEASFEAMGTKWNGLLEAGNVDNIFLTWEWMWTWWQVYGSSYRLLLLYIQDENEICVGIAPLKIARRYYHGLPYRQVEFIGYGPEVSPDHLDLIMASGYPGQVIDAVWSYLMDHRKLWDVLYLTDIPNASQTLSSLNLLTHEGGYGIERDQGLPCPYLPIQSSWEIYLKSLTQKHRYNLRKREKLLTNVHQITFDVIQTRPAIDEALEEVFKLHKSVWNAKGETGSFDRHIFNKEFHRRLVERISPLGWVVIYVLKIDGMFGALLYTYRYHNRTFHYQVGRDKKWDKYGHGQLLMKCILQHLFKEGGKEFDSLRGAEPYKYDWMKLERINLHLKIWNQSTWGRLLRCIMRMGRFLRQRLDAF